jgi:Fur family peroxide stress response transcriptional regulator
MIEVRGTERMATNGFRFTPQRRHVYSLLLQKRDHPTANEVFLRAKQGLPDISMATVYNCLDALVQCGLVRQVNLDRAATRYCPNMAEHCHFYCERCGRIFDVDYDPESAQSRVPIPAGFQVTHFEIAIRGLCAACDVRQQNKARFFEAQRRKDLD